MINKKNLIKAKSDILKAIRDYFYKTGALEVFTNILREYPNLDSNIYPLEVKYTLSNGESKKGYLHTSPEYEMKILLAEIKNDIYQITKVFRNFEGSKRHKIEFLMLEWYRVNYDLNDLMEDTKNIFIQSAKALYNSPEIIFNSKRYNLTDWEKISVEDAFLKYTGVDINDKNSMYEFLKNSPIKHEGLNPDNWEEMFYTIYSFYVEKNLGLEKPTFIYLYPKELGALAEVENDKALRFEAYIGGLELVNGYQELRDKEKLRKILNKDAEIKKKETGKEFPVDNEFINSIENLPKCSGASLGLDRLFMVLLNINDISLV
jgi:lysyl-tRNA synthetase class 2